MGGVKKAVKGIGKGIGRVVKGVAKGISRVGKGIWKGVKGVVKGAAKLMNKLGPIGTIALSFALPGIGSMLGSLWTSSATALGASGNAFFQAIGKGMTWVANAASKAGNFIKSGYNSITDKISAGLKQVGGSISEGASNMWQSTKDFFGVKDAGSIAESGEWIGKSAEKTFTQSAIDKNPEFLKMAGGNVQKAGQLARQQGAFLGESGVFAEAAKSGVAPNIIDTAKATNLNPFGEQAKMLAEQNFGDPFTGTAATAEGMSLGKEGLGMTAEAAAQVNPRVATGGLGDTLGKVLKGAANAFGSDDDKPTSFQQPLFTAGGDISTTTVDRGGIGGTGAAGGQFVDPTILAMLKANAQQLEALG